MATETYEVGVSYTKQQKHSIRKIQIDKDNVGANLRWTFDREHWGSTPEKRMKGSGARNLP